jgi:hypothetical protein
MVQKEQKERYRAISIILLIKLKKNGFLNLLFMV